MFSAFFRPRFWQPPNIPINPHSPIFPTKTPLRKRTIAAITATPSGAACFFLALLSFLLKVLTFLVVNF